MKIRTAKKYSSRKNMKNSNLKSELQAKAVIPDMKKRMADIFSSISWRELARIYFDKSSSWLYHKMDGIDGNGRSGGFTPEEAKQLKEALLDLSDRIRRAADSI